MTLTFCRECDQPIYRVGREVGWPLGRLWVHVVPLFGDHVAAPRRWWHGFTIPRHLRIKS